MENKSRVLIIGATGNLGHHLVNASLHFSHPTFALVRPDSFSDPHKSQYLQDLSVAGVTLLQVSFSLVPLIQFSLLKAFKSSVNSICLSLFSLEDEDSLVKAVKQVDVVICSVQAKQVLHQKLLIQVIKNAGSIKRFIPSEFGLDPDKTQISGMDYNFYSNKAEIRRLVEADGIPYTFVSCNFYTSYLLPSLVQPGLKVPPRDKVTIFGDGNTKGVFVKEVDVAAFTIRALDDPRTLNKVLYLRPPGNVYSLNELVELWESKIGKKLEKVFVSEEELLQKIKGTFF
ncbi:hypothetical protein ACLB2K_016765 [Fragaria x ananassa]